MWKGFLPVLLILALAACSDQAAKVPDIAGAAPDGVEPPPPGVWPDLACPSGAVPTARDRLREIQDWAHEDDRDDVEQAVIRCRDDHGDGPRHQGDAAGPLGEVYRAWERAKEANEATQPAMKARLWLSCRNELDHDP